MRSRIPRPRGRGLIEALLPFRPGAARSKFHDRAVVASLKHNKTGATVMALGIPRPRGRGLIEAITRITVWSWLKANSTTARSWPH